MPSISNFGNVYARPPVKNSPTTSSTQKQPAIRFGMNHPAGDTVSFDKESFISYARFRAISEDLVETVHKGSLKDIQSRLNTLLSINPIQRTNIINNQDQYGRTPLHWAAHSGSPAVVQLLLEKGAQPSVNTPDKSEETPLHHAVVWNENPKEVVQLLLEKGAQPSVNTPNYHNQTPLHLAARKGKPGLVKFLLENGATDSINKKDNDGRTPLMLVREYEKVNGGYFNGEQHIIDATYDILLSHGSNPEKETELRSLPTMRLSRVNAEVD